MKLKWGLVGILFFIFTVICLGSNDTRNVTLKLNEFKFEIALPSHWTIRNNYEPPKFSPNRSITYHKPYTRLKDELLYARISTGDYPNRRTVQLIRDKSRLVEVVREFDKLKASSKIEPPKVDDKTGSLVVTMWRKGTSVSYVMLEIEGNYYYWEKPFLFKKVSDSLLHLMRLKE